MERERQTTTRGKTAKKTPKTSETKQEGVKKQYLKSGSCKVTFILPKESAPDAETVNIVGEFNDWNKEATTMKKLKNGDFSVSIELQPGRKYRYKYLINGEVWENDKSADEYERNEYGTEDSVVTV